MTVYGVYSTDKDYDPRSDHQRSGHNPHRTPGRQFYKDEAKRTRDIANAISDRLYDPYPIVTITDDERKAMRDVINRYYDLAHILDCKSRGESVTGIRIITA